MADGCRRVQPIVGDTTPLAGGLDLTVLERVSGAETRASGKVVFLPG